MKRRARQQSHKDFTIIEFKAYLEKIGYQVEDLDRLNIIHVAGTKGKGSTCAFVSSILQQVDSPRQLKVGHFSSPHLIETRERIQINGKPISKALFVKYFDEVYGWLSSDTPPLRKVAPDSPSLPGYGRFLNLMAIHAFISENVDVAIFEVGVGGQYDSTNIVEHPVVCGISSLGIDHQAILGSTISSIAWHKAGIIKEGVPAFTVPQDSSALIITRARAAENNTTVTVVEPLPENKYKLGAAGEYQLINAALAEALCREWLEIKRPECSKEQVDKWVSEGLRLTYLPGRSHTFVSPRYQNLVWHLDAAHTVDSMTACAKWFMSNSEKGSANQYVLLFNGPNDYSKKDMLSKLYEHAGEINFVNAVFCPNVTNRVDCVSLHSVRDETLRQQRESAEHWCLISGATKKKVYPTINAAVEYIEKKYRAERNIKTHVLVTGSMYLVGGVLDVAKGGL
ncbi:Folylpolyglutamate synthetase [Coemansia sp. RSA 2599]|nr:Folylpolyglutamate synthetase [Coemansia sp. RSA 2598]KAJ1826746.1 Folylpolyglutamate synthetase [Coemansia sp. RSA 2599]